MNIVSEVLLFLVILLLLFSVRKRRYVEQELRKSNDELATMYKEALVAQEELLQQYDELTIIQESLYKSEERYKLAIDGANDGLWDYDFSKDAFYLSERSAKMMNIPMGVLSMGKLRNLIFYPQDRPSMVKLVEAHLAGKTEYFICEFEVKSAPGTWIHSRGKALRDAQGTLIRMAGSHTDITARKIAEQQLTRQNAEVMTLYKEMQAAQNKLCQQYEKLAITETALRQSEERYKLAMDGANDGLWDYSFINDQVYLSNRSMTILNIEKNELSRDELLSHILSPEDREKIEMLAREHIENKTPYFICEFEVKSSPETWVLSRSKILRDEFRNPLRLAGSFNDITETKSNQAKTHYLAYHDSLTGLANRTMLHERVSQAVQHGDKSNLGAIFFIDLDNFKRINDVYGHFSGDKLLILLGQRLSAIDGGAHFIARTGGDEFVFLLENIRKKSEAQKLAEKMHQLTLMPFHIAENVFNITMSIGVSFFPDDGSTIEELCKKADVALYSAKARGKNQHSFFSKGMDELVKRKMFMQSRLNEAISNNELQIFYQPVVCIKRARIIGFEALLRWQSKDFGMVMPLEFISLAEETGLIVPIGRLVLKTVCSFAAKLQKDGYDDLQFSVNLSIVELREHDFVEAVQKIIAEAKINPRNITFEITESAMMESIESNIIKLSEIRNNGIHIYLDDFGTGYSSLRYLKDFPIDGIKIDKSFVQHIAGTDKEAALTGVIIDLAKRIGLKPVAEGVETTAQLKCLKTLQCDLIQGYLFSKPIPEEEICFLLQNFSLQDL